MFPLRTIWKKHGACFIYFLWGKHSHEILSRNSVTWKHGMKTTEMFIFRKVKKHAKKTYHLDLRSVSVRTDRQLHVCSSFRNFILMLRPKSEDDSIDDGLLPNVDGTRCPLWMGYVEMPDRFTVQLPQDDSDESQVGSNIMAQAVTAFSDSQCPGSPIDLQPPIDPQTPPSRRSHIASDASPGAPNAHAAMSPLGSSDESESSVDPAMCLTADHYRARQHRLQIPMNFKSGMHVEELPVHALEGPWINM